MSGIKKNTVDQAVTEDPPADPLGANSGGDAPQQSSQQSLGLAPCANPTPGRSRTIGESAGATRQSSSTSMESDRVDQVRIHSPGTQ
ncbi:hypothetical protein E2562_025372 [Oryza meyeriana var. granulata]|uniref:Uncharacterized protein n=1 Tax=Oryza meyeriana var. granulata TaxID=110450 RepID=A0A6G1DN88_9ORYZ|nr:hypothetical protein E2562_025372 [Oryza meyeriana var. granulata]